MVNNLFTHKQKLAEFIGIMLGDGYISYPKNPRFKISFNSVDDKDYLIYVKFLLINLFSAKVYEKHRDNENTSELFIFKRKIIDYIIAELELKVSPKWNRAVIPSWALTNGLSSYVIRGLFDTDGSLVVTNNNGTTYPRLELKICPSPMQNQIINILSALNFKFGVYDIGKGKIRIQLNGKKQLKDWVNLIGFSNPKHMRKAIEFL